MSTSAITTFCRKKSVYEVISQGHRLIPHGRPRHKRPRIPVEVQFYRRRPGEENPVCFQVANATVCTLAMALKEEGNVLLLDEPTNDIDVNTLRALEEGLDDFAGCAVVVSHDRWFLDRICTHILSFEPTATWWFYEGSYSDYGDYKRARNGGKELPRRRYRKPHGITQHVNPHITKARPGRKSGARCSYKLFI